jgi:hypothetical protein
MKNVELLQQSILRFVIVAGVIIAIGYLIHHNFIFISTMSSFQFLLSGITIALSFSSFRVKCYREGLALLLLWFVILRLFSERQAWSFVLGVTYICVIAAAVYFYLFFVEKFYIKSILIRIVISSITLVLANALIIVILMVIANLFSHRPEYAHFPTILKVMLSNMIIGSQLGLLMGVGIELSDNLSNLLFIQKKSPN